MSAFERWGNFVTWLHYCNGDFELLERSAYFAEIRYPKTRRFTNATEWGELG